MCEEPHQAQGRTQSGAAFMVIAKSSCVPQTVASQLTDNLVILSEPSLQKAQIKAKEKERAQPEWAAPR